MHGNENGASAYCTGYFSTACLRAAACEVLLFREEKPDAFKQIVVGIDFSDGSRSALREAAKLAVLEGCPLNVVHVFAPDWELFGDRQDFREAIDEHIENLRERFSEWAAPVLLDLPECEPIFEISEDSSPANGIINYSSLLGADLLVVGLIGRSPVHQQLPGSTAEKVLSLADCSVMGVPPRKLRELHKSCSASHNLSRAY